MTAKEYLRRLARFEANIKAKKERLSVLKEMAESVRSPVITDMPKGSPGGTSRLEESVMKMISLENEINNDEARLVAEKTKALEMIGKIQNPDYQTVLISRYFKNESWEQIATDMFFTERWIYTLHGRALQELDDILKEFSRVQSSSVQFS
jgi:DNA-directed RNA polymerase specialized sigma24 family protein